MRIIVLGHGLPGQIVAVGLAARGQDVTVIGTGPQSTSVFSGSVHLWSTEPVRQYLQKVLRDPNVKEYEVAVKWARQGLSGWETTDEPTPEDLAVYGTKSQSRGRPCRGACSFLAIHDGIEKLSRLLREAAYSQGVRWINRFASSVIHGPNMVTVIDALGRKYGADRLVSTVPRDVYLRLIGAPVKDLIYKTFLHFSPTAPSRLPAPSSGVLLYLGRGTPFHRASWSREGGFCYEAMAPQESAHPSWSDVVSLPGRVRPGAADEVPVDETVHVGRWAELDPELMVSDVIAERERYLDQIISNGLRESACNLGADLL